MKNNMLSKITAGLLVQFLVLPLAANAQNSSAESQITVSTPTQCSDWSVRENFEQATAAYMSAATAKDPDFGCISRSAFMAAEDLFRPENTSLYIARLKFFDKTYRQSSKSNPLAQKAFEDFKVVLQFRWLSDNYQGMKNYKASKVVKGVTAAAAGTIVFGAAALLLRNSALLEIRSTARPALIRMAKYLGAVMFSRAASASVRSDSSKVDTAALTQRPPPLDLIGGSEQTFWNYSDLHMMRDLATVTAEALTSGVVQATVAVLAVKYIGAAANASGLLSAGSVIGLAVSYPLGKLAKHFADQAITDQYHKRHAAETLKLAKELNTANLTDWQTYVLAGQLTNSAITWVSTQDLYLENTIESQTVEFSHWQVCNRLREHALLSFNKKPQIGQSSPSAESQAIPAQSIEVFARAESKFRAKIYSEIEDKRPRLLEVREGILQRMFTLEKLEASNSPKPYLHQYVVEHRALIERLDRYLNHDRIVDDQLELLRSQIAPLSEDASVWKNAEFLSRIGTENHCN